MNHHRRFVLFGLPGSGKSTFAAKLGKKLNIPVHHLDKHMFEAGGKKRDKQEFLAIQKAILVENSWIIEGCAMSTLETRLAQAGTVIYFHLPRLLCMWRVLKRAFFPDRELQDTADGCTKVITWEILKYIWNFEKEKRGAIDALRKKYPQVEFHVFRTSRDANRYIEIM